MPIMDKTDVEILFALKQSPNKYMNMFNIIEKNPRLSIDETLKTKLRYLEEDKMIDCKMYDSLGKCYVINKKGNEYLWIGKIKERILNLLNISEFSLTDLQRFFQDIDNEELKKEISKMVKENSPLMKSYTTKENKFYHITTEGENYLKNKNNSISNSSPVIQYANQVNIANIINIQNFQSQIDNLIIQIDNEPNLSESQKNTFKEKLSKIKNITNETYDFAKPLMQNIVSEMLKEFFKLPTN